MLTPSVDTQILVQANGIDLGDSLTEHARRKLTHLAEKFFGKITECHAHFKRNGSGFCCSITYKVGGLPSQSVHNADGNIYAAFNGAHRKLERLMSRLKNEICDHTSVARPDKPIQNDGEHRVSMRHVPPDDTVVDLLSREGVIDYTERLAREGIREAERRRTVSDQDSFRIAAE